MKSFVLWTLLIAALIPLTACHWRHHHRHRHSANGYDAGNYAQNQMANLASDEASRAA